MLERLSLLKLIKGGFPLSRNFYVRTCVKFTFANEIGAMLERSHVNVKFVPRSISRFFKKKAQHFISCLYFYLRDKNLRYSGNLPYVTLKPECNTEPKCSKQRSTINDLYREVILAFGTDFRGFCPEVQ